MSAHYDICPHCREQIKKGASVCPHCRRNIAPAPPPPHEDVKSKKKMWE